MALRGTTGEDSELFDELTTPDVRHLSFAGSHSFLLCDRPGIGPLRYRQFSDWHPRAALFEPLCEIGVAATGDDVELRETDYQWYPDRAEMTFQAGPLAIAETIRYVGPDEVEATIELAADEGGSVSLELCGNVSPQAGASVTSTGDGGLRISVDADLSTVWSVPMRLRTAFCLLTEPELEWAIQDNSYRARLELAPGGSRSLRIRCFAQRDQVCPAKSVPSAASGAIAQWVRSLALPAHLPALRARRARQYWYWLWFSTQGPEGRWLRSIITPSRSAYGRGVWLWDSAFHVFGLLHGGDEALRLAEDQVRVLTMNLVDGRLPREVWVDCPGHGLQAPGVLTWAAVEIYRRTQSIGLLREAYPAFVSNHEWYWQNRQDPTYGLCCWDGCDSGWDTSPRWDSGAPIAIDLNSWLYFDQLMLAWVADVLQEPAAADWRRRAAETRQAVRNVLWDERDGIFYDLASDGRFVRVKTPAAFWPMFVGVASQKQSEQLAGRLTDPKTFWTDWPLPSVAADEPTFEPSNYWRGPVWVNLNWLTILGLRRYGFDHVAEQLTEATLRMIEAYPVTYEYYDPITGKGLGACIYQWTGALYTDLVAGQRESWW